MNSSDLPAGFPEGQEPAHEERRLPAPAQPAGIWLDWGPPLPSGYGQDRCTLMIRDPWCLFAYWELLGPHGVSVPAQSGPGVFEESQWRLRVFAGDILREDVPAAYPAGTRYVAVHPGETCRAEIGLLGPGGRWVVVAASATVRTPRTSPAPVVDDGWTASESAMFAQLGLSPEDLARRLGQLPADGRPGYEPPRPGESSPSAG